MSAFHPLQPLPCYSQSVGHSGSMAHMDQPEQGALFRIEGPDEDGCVWICSADGRDVWCHNLGRRDKVAEILSRWLCSVDYDEAKG
jgi:hypothetical protein